jgi:aryl-alcohol dehydrogenase (NADP+)
MFAWQFAKAQSTAEGHNWSCFISMQNHYNLIYREEEREMIPLCVDQGIGLIPWSPMARGFFAGNRHKQGGGETVRAQSDDFAGMLYFRPEDFQLADRAWEVAREHNLNASQIALAWLLAKPHITAPIIGTTNLDHLNQAIAALEVKLTPAEVQRLEELYQPHPVLGHT